MKRVISILTAAVLFAVLFTGCRTTPEEPVVIGKGDGQLEEKIAERKDVPLPSDIPGSGTRITETFKHDSLPITINATIDVEYGYIQINKTIYT